MKENDLQTILCTIDALQDVAKSIRKDLAMQKLATIAKTASTLLSTQNEQPTDNSTQEERNMLTVNNLEWL